jgi:hypothetical protein
MKFIEQELYFENAELSNGVPFEVEPHSKSLKLSVNKRDRETEILGVRVRLGNQPIVTNLRKLLERIHGTLPPKMELLFQEKEVYTIVHAIGVTRLKGKAKVDELHYDAEMIDASGEVIQGVQTIDLIPHTRFKDVVKANVSFGGGLSVSGNAMTEIPEEFSNHLLEEYVSVGGAMNLQLSTSSSFVGKFTYSLKFPVVISTGIASNTCHWMLKPNEDQTPLLGDQLLVQTVAVPKGTDKIKFRVKGTVKVDKGLFFKQHTQHTDEYDLEVNLF